MPRRSAAIASNAVQGLIGFDLDGTLLRGMTVCEVLAEALGHSDVMKRYERLATERDISEARMDMARWYQGHTYDDLQAHLESACLAPGAHEAISLLKSRGFEVAIVSTTWSFAVRWFAERFNVVHYLGTGLSPTGEITHVWGRDKARWLRLLASELGIPLNRIAAVGDSSGDVDMLHVAALRFFVGAKLPAEVERVVHIPGAGIREIADRILREWSA